MFHLFKKEGDFEAIAKHTDMLQTTWCIFWIDVTFVIVYWTAYLKISIT